ncbi:GNAT family N-acetyltransferase [Actinoallomurus sp. NPDC050550]|uniref:GNAT family N-acetyltransferase n=1 Tax=Actinoallomurus sp. NPDC050550 TaxID=3154937 RepID=UPI0033EF4CEE
MSPTLPAGFGMVEGVPEERYQEWLDCWLGAFGSPPGADEAMVGFYRRTHPPERAIAIYDDGGYVATNTSLHRDFVLPGGATVPMAACTGGSCHPTLTRRGLMSVTLDRLHRRAAEEGKALCAGGVSEWPIYRRFGYGPATWYDSVEIDVRRTRLRDDVPGEGVRPRRVEGAEAREVARRVYTRQAATTPGEVVPPDCFWDRLAMDPGSPELEMMLALSGPGGPRHCAAIGDRGLVSYRIMPDWTDEQAPNNVLQVIDFLAADDETAGALWRHLFSIDMIGEIHVWRLPVDDPLRWWAVDARWIRTRPKDGMWLRLIDVPRLLSARTWSADGALTLRVHDDQGYAEGTYRLEAGAGTGSCARDTATPDLEMDVSALGAILLGGTSAAGMARSGRIQAKDPRHVRLWDTMATPERAPFISYWF